MGFQGLAGQQPRRRLWVRTSCAGVRTSGNMRAVLAALLALALGPGARAAWLGRLDPKQLLGPWYVVAVASGERDFAVEKATKNIEGVVVTLTPENNLKVRASRHRLERCHMDVVELLRQNPAWVFRNPSRGVLEYRVLGTDFRDFAIVFTQLEQRDEAFSTVELYSRTQQASPEAVSRFTRWSQGLGFLSQQQAQLQADATCAHRAFQVSCLPSIVGLPGLPSRQEGPGALGAPAPLWAAGPSGQRARGQSRRLSSEPGSPVFVLVSSECCGPWGDSAHQDPVGLARRSLPCSAAQVLVVGPASPRGSGCRTK
ncbi:epididymal-specific lipocalin-6 isoform 3-T3 [Glossophaga mutica]